jgi:hypothetical protein
MQKTDINQIIKNIDKVIYRALNIRYNKNSKFPLFSAANIISPNQSGIHYSVGNIDLYISSQESVLSISKIEYRIPQTKLYITYLQTKDYSVRILHYFNLSILIAEFFHENSQQIIEIRSEKYPIHIQYPTNYDISDKLIKVPKDNIFIAQISNETLINLPELPDQINQIIDEEIHMHPISKIQTENMKFLSELDQYWVKINAIDKNNNINFEELVQKDMVNLIWMQEIYMHLGWFNQLKIFYEDIIKYNLSSESKKILLKCLSRYHHICNICQTESIELKIDKQNINHSGLFLSYLLQSTDYNDDNIYEEIQKKWNYLHIPAIRLKLQELIYDNPDEFIALAYLALQYRFWWYEKLEEIILSYLPEEKMSIFRVLSLINKFAIMRFKNDSIYLSRYVNSFSTQISINLGNLITKKDTRKIRERFTCIEKNSKFYVKINKCVDFEYIPKSNCIHIKPQLFTPWKYIGAKCLIEISDYLLYVPLIWDQFTIKFNKCRFKFLRKKDRFQVTIKFAKVIQRVKLNDEQIENNLETIKKYYIPVKRAKSEIDISIFNEYGAKIIKNNQYIGNIVLKGYGLNTYGILNNNFRIFPNNQKKSYAINLDEMGNPLMFLSNDGLELTLKASKFDPIKLQLYHADSLIMKLISMNASELFYKLKIFMDNYKQHLNEIRSICETNLGFIPQIGHLSEIVPDRNNIITIISSLYRNETLNGDTEFKIIPINKKTNQKALWINPAHLNYMFTETFFRSLYE